MARSILRTFDWGAKDLPIQLLRSHLITNKEKLNLLDPTKMEQLVQSVFREHFDCEVTHCGRTADGGLDLYFIDGDEPVAVQIKARRHREKPEPVEGIREFLGAMMLKGYKAGVFVSSAGRFTKPATIAANQAVEMGLATRYELVDADRFLKLLELRYPGDQSPWVDCVNAHFQEIASKLRKGLPG